MKLFERLGLIKKKEEQLPPPLPVVPMRRIFTPTDSEREGLRQFSIKPYQALEEGKEYTNKKTRELYEQLNALRTASDAELRARVGKLELALLNEGIKKAQASGDVDHSPEIGVISAIVQYSVDSGQDGEQVFKTLAAVRDSLKNLDEHHKEVQRYQGELEQARTEALELRRKEKRHNRKMAIAQWTALLAVGLTGVATILYSSRYHTSNALANQAITEISQLRTQLSQQQEYFKSYSLASATAFTNEINTRIEDDSKLRTLLAGVNSRTESTAQKVDSLDYAINLASMLYPQVLKLQQDSQESRENNEALTRNLCSLEEQVSELRGDNAGIITDIAELRRSGATQLELESYKLEVAGRFQREIYPRMQGLNDRVVRLETNQTQQQKVYEKLLLQNTNSIPPGKEVEQQIKEAARIKLNSN